MVMDISLILLSNKVLLGYLPSQTVKLYKLSISHTLLLAKKLPLVYVQRHSLRKHKQPDIVIEYKP